MLDEMIPVVYAELRQIAHRQLQAERAGHTLNTTGLVHEAYLKLAGLERVGWKNQGHFLALAAQAMRYILVNHAVRRKAAKRGGGQPALPLEEAHLMTEARAEEILALHEALRQLELLAERPCRVVECRFFGGLTVEETAEALAVSAATVKRDWQTARAWLNRELS